MRKWVSGFISDLQGWHRGLPDPPGKPTLNLRLIGRVLRESNAAYLAGLKAFYLAPFQRKKDTGETEEQKMERESSRTAQEAAKTLKGLNVPTILRTWVGPKMALMSEAMMEFGKGFREGKNAPETKIDIKEWIRRDDKEKD